MKPFFSDKSLDKNCITLVEDNKILSDDTEVADTLNSFLQNS